MGYSTKRMSGVTFLLRFSVFSVVYLFCELWELAIGRRPGTRSKAPIFNKGLQNCQLTFEMQH